MSDGMETISKYELKNCIATGNYSQIWEVVEQGSGRQFAMKLLLPEAHKDRGEKAVLKHEFKIGKSLEHPSIIRFHEIEVSRDHGFFLMDYFRAPSLKAQISSNKTNAQARFKKTAEAVTLALSYMHEKGLLHRDIKPENILMNKGGEVRLIDFSLSAKAKSGLGKALAGKSKTIKGTRTYIAPETLLKKQPTFQTDIYSLGVTFYEVLTGSPPFAGTSPNELCRKHVAEVPAPPSFVNRNITPEADMLILKMLEKKPEKRHESMKELYSAFRALKVWHKDVIDLADAAKKKEEEDAAMSVDQRLDSRADAKRKAMGLKAPERKKKKKPKILLKDLQEEEKRVAAAKQQPAPTQPMQPVPMQQMPMPMYPPQQPMYMPPPQMPQQPMPGYAMPMPPQQMPMQMPPQQMPPMPPQQMPPQGMPPQQLPPQAMPPQQMPPQPQAMPPQPAPPQQQPPAQPPQPQQPTVQQPTTPRETEAPLGSPLRRATAPRPAPTEEVDESMEFFTDLDDLSLE